MHAIGHGSFEALVAALVNGTAAHGENTDTFAAARAGWRVVVGVLAACERWLSGGVQRCIATGGE